MNKLFAKRIEMTVKFTDRGDQVGASVLQILPMKVEGLRNKDKHGYSAIRLQITNHKSQITKEIRTEETPEIGMEVKLDEVLKVGDLVSVAGVTKGKGFAGAVKRHGFAGGPRTHGQSDRERAPGSSGSTTTPGRVYKGKRRAGHMGVTRVVVKNLKVLEVNAEKNQLIIAGSVPGARKYTFLEVTRL